MALIKTKKNPVVNTFEQVADVGKKSVTESAKAVADTFTFADYLGLKNADPTPGQERVQKDIKEKTDEEKIEKGINFTELDAKRITEESQKIEQARQQLFNLVKSEETKAIEALREEERRRQEEEIRKQREEEEEQKKKQQLQQQDAIPQGKVRRQIGGKQKTRSNLPAQNFENKSNKGK